MRVQATHSGSSSHSSQQSALLEVKRYVWYGAPLKLAYPSAYARVWHAPSSRTGAWDTAGRHQRCYCWAHQGCMPSITLFQSMERPNAWRYWTAGVKRVCCMNASPVHLNAAYCTLSWGNQGRCMQGRQIWRQCRQCPSIVYLGTCLAALACRTSVRRMWPAGRSLQRAALRLLIRGRCRWAHSCWLFAGAGHPAQHVNADLLLRELKRVAIKQRSTTARNAELFSSICQQKTHRWGDRHNPAAYGARLMKPPFSEMAKPFLQLSIHVPAS